ncbi:MAG: 30S ribosomal protein S4 [Candidatus Woesearchaeota archaeon]
MRRARKQYATPNHPWNKERIESEAQLVRGYGLKNKKEIYKATFILRNFRTQAKRLSTRATDQDAREEAQLLTRLRRLGLIGEEDGLDAVLGIQIEDLLERRLQTIVYRKALAKSMKQARQFIAHAHITIDGVKITAPGHLTTLEEQEKLSFRERSSLSDEEHPERAREKTVEVPEAPEADE